MRNMFLCRLAIILLPSLIADVSSAQTGYLGSARIAQECSKAIFVHGLIAHKESERLRGQEGKQYAEDASNALKFSKAFDELTSILVSKDSTANYKTLEAIRKQPDPYSERLTQVNRGRKYSQSELDELGKKYKFCVEEFALGNPDVRPYFREAIGRVTK